MFFTKDKKNDVPWSEVNRDWITPLLTAHQRDTVNDLFIEVKSELLNIMVDLGSFKDTDALSRMAGLIKEIDKRGRV